MEIIESKLKGVYIIKNKIFSDDRGRFIKTFNEDDFKKNNMCSLFKESYFSISGKNVIRGMHFQLPPFDHEKLVYVPKGRVIDVILDLRKNSQTCGQSCSIELSDENGYSVYIPKGLAHGFKSLTDGTIMVYNVSTVYQSNCDFGVRWDSFDFDWNLATMPIISERDKNFISLDDFMKKGVF